ncbi:MAG: PIN domain-containing protein [Planctomycetes bacterium]|nr:PIN domain-containing protein [Planctomycetota bacterium]
MKTLLDTCVLSELQKPRGKASVRAAVEALPDDDLYLSALTVGELAQGIAQLPAGKRKRTLERWLVALETDHAPRLLPVDAEVARRWGQLNARLRHEGRPIPAIDGLLAATALAHGLHLMTRNTRDFEPTGVPLLNPWSA